MLGRIGALARRSAMYTQSRSFGIEIKQVGEWKGMGNHEFSWGVGFSLILRASQVARMASTKVDSEEAAEAIDDIIIGKGLQRLKEIKGFAGIERYFCKEHFDYKVVVTFQGLDNFKKYMESHEKDMEDKFVEVLERSGMNYGFSGYRFRFHSQDSLIEAASHSTDKGFEFQNFVSSKFGSFGGGQAFRALSVDDFTAF
eukprot:1316882-Amorphochlora_amoeboformis.AAC.1